MPSAISTRPSFTSKDNDPSDTYRQDLKASIIKKYGAENLQVSWKKTCKALTKVTSRLAAYGNASVPIFTYGELLDKSKLETMKAAGCCIIRGVILKSNAEQYFKDLKTFINDNKEARRAGPVSRRPPHSTGRTRFPWSGTTYRWWLSCVAGKMRSNVRHMMQFSLEIRNSTILWNAASETRKHVDVPGWSTM
jgi:hypothetical protein